MTSFGIDVTYIPWNTTLSSVINRVGAAAQSEAYNTLYLALSYDFRCGVTAKVSEVPVTEESPPPTKAKPAARPKVKK